MKFHLLNDYLSLKINRCLHHKDRYNENIAKAIAENFNPVAALGGLITHVMESKSRSFAPYIKVPLTSVSLSKTPQLR